MKPRFMIVARRCRIGLQPDATVGAGGVLGMLRGIWRMLLVTRHFSGVVLTEDGGPVPAATVALQPSCTPRNEEHATTDGNGFYQLTLDQPASWAGTYAKVTQALYEDTAVEVPWLPSQTDVTKSFRLNRSVTLAAGESCTSRDYTGQFIVHERRGVFRLPHSPCHRANERDARARCHRRRSLQHLLALDRRLGVISEGHSLIDIDRHSDNGRC